MELLKVHLARERARGSAAVIYLGTLYEDERVDVCSQRSAHTSVKEFHCVLQVTDDGLWAPTYTDLTMAAQFDDEPVVPDVDRAPHLQLAAGRYAVAFRVLRDLVTLTDLQASSEPVLEVVVVAEEDAAAVEADTAADVGVPWLDF